MYLPPERGGGGLGQKSQLWHKVSYKWSDQCNDIMMTLMTLMILMTLKKERKLFADDQFCNGNNCPFFLQFKHWNFLIPGKPPSTFIPQEQIPFLLLLNQKSFWNKLAFSQATPFYSHRPTSCAYNQTKFPPYNYFSSWTLSYLEGLISTTLFTNRTATPIISGHLSYQPLRLNCMQP